MPGVLKVVVPEHIEVFSQLPGYRFKVRGTSRNAPERRIKQLLEPSYLLVLMR